MKYKELVKFDPIETIIQLRDAGKAEKAKNLVKTYVVSDEMADRINEIIVPHLQFEEPRDNKGLLVVGNYGTGKSHLLSVISIIAENADALANLNNNAVKQKAKAIANR